MNLKESRGLPDFLLLFLTLALVGTGIAIVYSSSSIIAYHSEDYNYDPAYFMQKQIQWSILGFIGMLATMNIPMNTYKKLFGLIAAGSFALLLLVYVPGVGMKLNGARSWIGIGSNTIQPLEFAKLGIIIYLAGSISNKKDKFRNFKEGLAPILGVAGCFLLAIAVQPDLGGSAIVGLTVVIIIYCGGAKLKHLLILGTPVGLVGLIYTVSADYRLQRILTFTNPWNDGEGGRGNGYQLIQSLYAIAHGGWSGAGFGKSIQKYMYLPYPHTDFIFAVMVEELGAIGCFVFLSIFMLFIWRIIYTTLNSGSTFGGLIGIGVASLIVIQSLVNMGGVTGSMPITGVTLPFISYGGSSLFALMLGMGVVLSVSRETYKQKATKKLNSGNTSKANL